MVWLIYENELVDLDLRMSFGLMSSSPHNIMLEWQFDSTFFCTKDLGIREVLTTCDLEINWFFHVMKLEAHIVQMLKIVMSRNLWTIFVYLRYGAIKPTWECGWKREKENGFTSYIGDQHGKIENRCKLFIFS